VNQIGSSKVDALWFLVSTGSDPATANHAVIYFDGQNRANPNVAIYRYDPALGQTSWQNAANLMVSTAPGSTTAGDVLQKKVTETGSSARFQLVLDVSRLNNATNWSAMGIDAGTWEGVQAGGSAGIALRMVDLDSAPTYDVNGGLTAFSYTPGVTTEGAFVTDPAGVFTLATEPCSVSPWVSVGNFVWNDANNNGLRDVGEIGISGATVQLFSPGADNAIGGSGLNADTQVGASIVTNSAGAYTFNNLVAGKYYVRVTPPVSIPGTGGVPVALDNDIDNDNNGAQPGGPGTPLFSPVVDLAIGLEPGSAVDGDGTNSNGTIDFGLFTGLTVGDLVWNDLNNDGLKDTTEAGVSGVQVDLMSPGADGLVGGTGLNADTVMQTTSTQSNGSYSFKTYAPGAYYVRLTPPASFSLASSAVVTADNGVNGDNNGSQPAGAGTEVMSMVFQLTAGGEPGSTGVTNTENTIDFGLRSCPVITITPGTLADAMRGSSYGATFNAAGGNSPYTWSISSGALPTGLSLSSAGVLSGTANASPATYSFTVRVRDASNCSATQAMTLRVLCPVLSLSPTTLTSVTQGSVVNQQFTASGGASPYTYTRASGTLPAGLSISSGGLLSGTITGAPGAYSFVIRATDANGCLMDNAITWNITCPSLVLTPATLPAATQYAAYTPQTLTTSAGTGPYQWSLSGTLPAGMTFTTSGVLSGTPTSAPGTYNVTISATDANGCAGSRIYGIVVNCPAISITAPAMPSGTKGVDYPAQQLAASAGTAPYTWSLASGTLPAGLSLSNTGLISGTPSGVPATYNFTVRATDGVNCSTTRALQIVIACPTLSIGPVPLPSAVQYASYSQTLAVGGGTAPYTWSLASGVLPTGMTLSAGGVLSGAPTSLGSSTFVVRATDADGCSSTQSYTFTVDYPPISILPPTLPDATRLVPYFQQITASGGTAPYTYSKLTGNLPSGITISSTGVISGSTTAAPGAYSFTVQALDANGAPGTQPYTITVLCPDFVITPSSLSNATVGSAYSAPLNAVGGSAPYVWSVASGTLPAGLSLSSSGLISGTPTQAMTASFTVEARDAYNCAATRLYTLAVNCPSMSITPATLSSAYYGSPYSQQLNASGGTGPYTWSVIAGTPPAGITLSSSGLLSGTSSVYGTASFTVRVTDSYNCSSTQSYSLLVKGLSLGDVVYEDTNFNGLRDNGEPGIKDVTVELWDPGADHAIGGSGPNSDLLLRSAVTGALGQYHFDNLQPGSFFLRVLMPTALNIPGGNPVNLDNGTDNDNNSASQPGGAGTPVFSPIIALTKGGEPTVEDSDPDTDYTIDFGIFRGMSVGNLVWQDTNDNGLRDPGEPGIDGVLLELWTTGADNRIGGTDDVLLRATTSANGGEYLFTALPPLTVYVRVPAPPAAQPLSSSVTISADNGIDHDDNGHQINGGATYSHIITLTPADEPGTGGGTYDETTIDFGFYNVTPSIYVSATQADSVQTFDATTGLYTGPLVSGFGNSLSQGNTDWGDLPYAIEFGQDGNWYVAHYGASNLRKISPAGLDLGPVLDNSNASVSLIAQFTIGPDGHFYVVDANGGRVVRFQGPSGTTPGAPIGAAPFTFITQTGVEDINFGPDGNLYLVVQTGADREVRRYSSTTGAWLNTVVSDTQIVDMVPGGQSIALISGIDIHDNTLYGVNRSDGEVFRVDLTTPAAPGLPQLIATISTAGMGDVDTRDIEFNPANGRLYISGYHWGKPVNAGAYISGALINVDVAGAPNGTVSIHEVPIPRPPGPNNEIWAGPRDLAIGRPFAPLPQSVAIGSIVWNDIDADGIQDASEQGISGVRVELWQDANGNVGDGAEFLVGWTYTDTNGHYYFSGQAPGVYQVQIPVSNFVDGLPLAGSGYSSPITSILDDQIDGDDSGRQPDGPKTAVYSPLITLTPGTEPLGNGTSAAEHARGGELDNYTVDANGDMTIDFGFVEPGIMGIGNLVFVDANGNNRFDVGEGRDEATVELYRWGDIPGVTQPVATTVTANGGLFLFSNLWQGQYFIHLPAPQFEANGGLRGLFSLPGFSNGDDDTGEDSIDSDSPWVTGVSSSIINLVREEAPTDTGIETGHDSATDLDDFNINLTVDIGLFRPVALGNLVFADNNSNGHFDASEGLPGVRVELYADTQFPGLDNPLSFVTTDAQGRYGFNFLRPGNYVVHVPASQFQSGAPLFQRISILEGLVGDDDVGEDGVNNGDPATNGVSSLVISLFPGNAPTDDSGETGFESNSDNQIDAAVDLTIDFGFQTPVGVGNLVYIDSNENGFADVGEGVDGVTVELYRADQTPGFGLPIFARVTSNGGRYFFDSLPAGDYRLHIPSSEFEPGRPLFSLESAAGAGNVTAVVDDDAPDNENGIDDPTPFLNGISSAVFSLAVDAQPTAASGETGIAADIDAFDDDNFNLTLDFGFAPSNPNAVGVGNLVFVDLNGNGVFDAGEGIDGVKVQLFAAAADPLSAVPLASTHTNNGGHYVFGNLAEGDYFVFIPPSEFAAGKPLSGWRSIPGDGADNGIDDNLDENGIDSVDPTTTGIASASFSLAPDLEPTNSLGEFGADSFSDDVNDDNNDLTIDFGFFRSVGVGNLVFIDANYNGRADSGEGVSGVTVEIYTENSVIPFDAPVATTASATDGTYLFSDLAPGRYFLRVPSWQFDFGMPLYFHASSFGVQSGDDLLGEDGIDDGNPSANGIQTAVFELSSANAPVGSQEGGHLGSSDDLDDASTNLTLDFGFVPQVTIGNLVFSDANNDGIFDPNTELGVDGVTVELWSNLPGSTTAIATTTTSGGGLYSFNVAPGSYYVRVPASNFAEGAALAGSVPSLPVAANAPSTTSGDDDTAQDGYTTGSALTEGVRTALFTVLLGNAPTLNDTETGYLSEGDDYADADVDLTIDLGFSPKPLSVGNLVFRDLNSNGIYDGSDFGVAGVKLRLFRFGDDPNDANTVPVMETTSALDGSYLLSAYTAGQYFIHVPASEFAAGGLLVGASSSPGFGNDDGTDDEAGEDGLDAAAPALTGVTSIVFELAYGTEPEDAGTENGYLAAQDSFNDTDADLTIDFGFSGGDLPNLMSIGNLVFDDINQNGVADLGEGVPGVWMLLYAGTNSTTAIRSTYTDANGRYLFSNLSPGTYTVHVAADNFKESISINNGPVGPGPLFRCISMRGHQTAMADDNIGEDGIDAQHPEQVGITAPPVTLVAGAAPSGTDELGFQGTSDDSTDGNVNLSIDFGFATRLGFGNLVFRDVNADGKFQTGIDTGLTGITLELVHVDGVSSEETVIGSTSTDANGAFILYGPPVTAPHGYKVRIPAAQFAAAGPLNFLVPTVLSSSGNDDNVNQNAQPAAQPETTGVTTAVFTPVSGAMPTDADGRETGFDKTSDNAFDSDNDLTLDIGLKPKAIMVGNLIFRDVNDNGTFESGIDLPVPNVTVRLFQQTQVVTDTPVSEAVTAANGTYLLQATSPAAYYVHIPASMFASGAPLNGLVAVAGLGNVSLTTTADTAKDDRFDENGTDPSSPDVSGVSSGIINLAYGSMPVNSSPTASTGENGYESFMDDVADSSGIMTIDFGFAAPAGQPLSQRMTRDLASGTTETANAPATFTSWQSQHSLAGLSDPEDDPDADGHTNLLEYALGTSPASGAQLSRFRLVTSTTTGLTEAVLTRPAGEHRDLRYVLESSADLKTWTQLSISPSTTIGAGQTETLRFADLETATALEQGFVRLKVQLDADLNGTAEAAAVTPAQGWSRRTFTVGRQTLSMPLLKPAVFIGRVSSVNDTQISLPVAVTLPPETAHYLEVLDGPLSGQTFDIGSDLKLASVAAVAGARVAIRPHWTLATLLPASAFEHGSTPEEADRALTFDSATNSFQTHPLADEATATRVVPPQEGLFVQIRTTDVTLSFLGEVRAAPLALPQSAGTRFIGTGLALPLAPGSQPHTTGSRLRLWSGDADPSTAAYHNYLLNDQSRWIDETTGIDITTQPAFDAFRAYFLVK
jgi:protocatechuate 3,4-dioxygenase beta subunit